MKHLILFWILIATLAAAAETKSAKIDGRKKVLKLTETTDCNNVMPMLHFDADASAEGDPVYDLEFATTRMACPDQDTREQKVEVKLPPRRPGEHVIIKNGDHEFAYDVTEPQEDEDLLAANGDDDDTEDSAPAPKQAPEHSKLILHIFSDAIR